VVDIVVKTVIEAGYSKIHFIDDSCPQYNGKKKCDNCGEKGHEEDICVIAESRKK
jgi:hypothetical protein